MLYIYISTLRGLATLYVRDRGCIIRRVCALYSSQGWAAAGVEFNRRGDAATRAGVEGWNKSPVGVRGLDICKELLNTSIYIDDMRTFNNDESC